MQEHEIDDSALTETDPVADVRPEPGQCAECQGAGVIASGEVCPVCEGTGKANARLGGG